MELDNTQLVLIIAAGIYLVLGLIYAIYGVVAGGQGVFTIPVNMLFGPVFFPINYLIGVRSILKKREAIIDEEYLDSLDAQIDAETMPEVKKMLEERAKEKAKLAAKQQKENPSKS